MGTAGSETHEMTRFNEAIDQTIARYSEELSRSRELLLAVLMSARFMRDYVDLNEPGTKAADRILNSTSHR